MEPGTAIIRSAAARIDPRTKMVTMAFTLAAKNEAEGNSSGALSDQSVNQFTGSSNP
jgi:hypothetical protein